MDLNELKSIAKMISILFSPHVETVIHDLKKKQFPILAIYNAEISGRKVGDKTQVFSSLDPCIDTIDTVHYYDFTLESGKKIKSSSMVFKDNGKPTYALSINFDTSYIQEAIRMLSHLADYTPPAPKKADPILDKVSEELVQNELYRVLMSLNLSLNSLSKTDLKKVITKLYESGLLQRRKVVPILSKLLGITKATIYNYKRQIQGE